MLTAAPEIGEVWPDDGAPPEIYPLQSSGASGRKLRMSQISKQVENRLEVAKKVVVSARVQAPSLVPRLKVLTGQDFTLTFEAMANALERANDGLRVHEEAYTAEQADDAEPRRRRDQAVLDLVKILVAARTALDGVLTSQGLTRYGLTAVVPRVGTQLSTYAANVLQLLQKQPFEGVDDLGSVVSTPRIHDLVKAKLAVLDEALKSVTQEERELQDVLGLRDEALAHWTDVYQGIATALEGLYRLGGRADLADRVRPTSRTVSGEDSGGETEPTEPVSTIGNGPFLPEPS